MRAALAMNLLALGLALVPVGGAAETLPAVVPQELPKAVFDSTLNFLVIGDQLEFRANDGDDQFRWDVQAWVGGRLRPGVDQDGRREEHVGTVEW